jgi:sulfite exporter TauE/SafE/copper chaperone CopZ
MSSREFLPPIQSWEAELEGKLQKKVRYDRTNVREPIRPRDTPGDRISATVQVAGMTCRSCEVRIQRHVGGIPNVLRVTASAIRGQVEVESSAPISAGSIALAIEAAGYKVGQTRWVERNPAVWLTAAAGILMVAAFAVLAQRLGLAGVASGAGSLSSGGLVVALLLGLAAGVSTCMALVGGLVLAMSAAFQKSQVASGVRGGVRTQMRPALVFMAGRIVGYGVLGAALGAVGAGVTMPPRVTAMLMIAVAVVMIILGTRLTGLSPRIATWSPTLPMGIGRRLGLSGGSASGYSDRRAAGLGAASFFLPCGFTQAVQIYALSTGSPLFAGALMATFAIGTSPGLLAVAGLPVVVPSRLRPTLLRLVGVVVLGFAVLNGSAGLRLAGISLPASGAKPVAVVVPAATEPVATEPIATEPIATEPAPTDLIAAAPTATVSKPAPTATPDKAQRLTTYQNEDGYTPEEATIYAGIPTHWTIKSTSNVTCTFALVVPDLSIEMTLKLGDNTIELPALSKGKLDYSCAMGMVGGRINVIDPPSGSGS